jgi:hypothetical protein
MVTNDIMHALEEKIGLEFKYRERFSKPTKILVDMDADQEPIEQLAQQFSINPDLIDEKDTRISEYKETFDKLKTINEVRFELMDKSHIHIHETITNMAILVFKKSEVQSNEISKSV